MDANDIARGRRHFSVLAFVDPMRTAWSCTFSIGLAHGMCVYIESSVCFSLEMDKGENTIP